MLQYFIYDQVLVCNMDKLSQTLETAMLHAIRDLESRSRFSDGRTNVIFDNYELLYAVNDILKEGDVPIVLNVVPKHISFGNGSYDSIIKYTIGGMNTENTVDLTLRINNMPIVKEPEDISIACRYVSWVISRFSTFLVTLTQIIQGESSIEKLSSA